MKSFQQKNADFRKAFVRSFVIHLFVLFLLWLLAPDSHQKVVLQVELDTPYARQVRQKEVSRKQKKIIQKKRDSNSHQKKEESSFEKFFQKARKSRGRQTGRRNPDADPFAKSRVTGKKSKSGLPIVSGGGRKGEPDGADLGDTEGEGELPREIPGGKTGLKKTGKGSIAGRKILFRPSIPYPLYYRKKGIQGSAVFYVEVAPDGKIVQTRLKKSTGYPDLDILAERGVRQTRFSASRSKVNDVGEITVNFGLNR